MALPARVRRSGRRRAAPILERNLAGARPLAGTPARPRARPGRGALNSVGTALRCFRDALSAESIQARVQERLVVRQAHESATRCGWRRWRAWSDCARRFARRCLADSVRRRSGSPSARLRSTRRRIARAVLPRVTVFAITAIDAASICTPAPGARARARRSSRGHSNAGPGLVRCAERQAGPSGTDPFQHRAIRDPDRQPLALAPGLLAQHPQEAVGGQRVVEGDQHQRLGAVIVGRPLRGVSSAGRGPAWSSSSKAGSRGAPIRGRTADRVPGGGANRNASGWTE